MSGPLANALGASNILVRRQQREILELSERISNLLLVCRRAAVIEDNRLLLEAALHADANARVAVSG